MIARVLLAVDDTPAGFAAARVAIGLASDIGATVRAVHVLADHELSALLGTGTVCERRALAGSHVLHHVAELALAARVSCEPLMAEGDPVPAILAQAGAWPADLVVLGRSTRPGPGRPSLSTTVRHLLELADRPVLVVPAGPGHSESTVDLRRPV
ncbi:universal stress protein [Amycolatopsis sp. NPDC021455]|uniref:universal stress protein n=1 Tax=Amycolatopsis sp. NPDC021455 TaxID=3154901 RepID=UPI0033F16183